jgi:GntR family transcriptional regulator / MocR family aminotransferase
LLAGWPSGLAGVGQLPGVAAGLHLTVRVDSLAREQQLLEQARAVEVEVNGLSTYWLAQSTTPVDQRAGLVLGFAAVPEPAIAQALARLTLAWQASTSEKQ